MKKVKNRTFYSLMILLGIIILLAGITLIFYYYKSSVDECTSNPLSYGARQMEESYGIRFEGYGYFLIDGQQSPIIWFNSSNILIKNYN